MSFQQKIETIQYNSALPLTGAIRGSSRERCLFSREKICQELGLETLQQRRWYRKLCSFYKILKSQSPKYFSFKCFPKQDVIQDKAMEKNSSNKCETRLFQEHFFSFNKS